MKRICFAMAATLGVLVSATAARADFGGPPQPQMPTSGPFGQAASGPSPGEQERYGLLPAIKQVVFWRQAPPVAPAQVPYPYPAYMPPGGYGYPPTGHCNPAMLGTSPGTLAFPNHQYNRSPRDFFMWQPNR